MGKWKGCVSQDWQDGYDACCEGQTEWECPYDENTPEARDWLSGWQACDFDDRAQEQIAMMEAQDVRTA